MGQNNLLLNKIIIQKTFNICAQALEIYIIILRRIENFHDEFIANDLNGVKNLFIFNRKCKVPIMSNKKIHILFININSTCIRRGDTVFTRFFSVVYKCHWLRASELKHVHAFRYIYKH